MLCADHGFLVGDTGSFNPQNTMNTQTSSLGWDKTFM